jgi:serine/threonine protein kinase
MVSRLHHDRNGNRLIDFKLGEPPWSEFKSPMTVLYNIYHAKEPPLIPINLSPSLKDFINCCLKIEPQERWNVFQLLRHPFITGDHFTFFSGTTEQNVEFENKFFSEDKNSR